MLHVCPSHHPSPNHISTTPEAVRYAKLSHSLFLLPCFTQHLLLSTLFSLTHIQASATAQAVGHWRPGSIPGQSMRNLWQTKWRWHKFIS